MIFRADARPISVSAVGNKMVEFAGLFDGRLAIEQIGLPVEAVSVTVHDFDSAARLIENAGEISVASWNDNTAVALHYRFESKSVHLVVGLDGADWKNLIEAAKIALTRHDITASFSCVGQRYCSGAAGRSGNPTKDEFEAGAWIAMSSKVYIFLKADQQ